MKYMLDTNICSYIIKYKPAVVHNKFNAINMDDCCISAITYLELKNWVIRNERHHKQSKNHGNPKINEYVINSFVSRLNIINFDTAAADICADVKDKLEAKGIIVGSFDLLIGAHAISSQSVLVTNNSKDFIHFPNIKLENWVTDIN